MITFSRAIVIATKAHAGQVDRGGQPYILHPLRVMLQMPDDEHRIIAVLHDVIEDTDVQALDLVREGCGARISDALDDLTRREGETYDAFIERVSRNPLAIRVKLADIEDNRRMWRLPQPLTDADWARDRKYAQALDRLKRVHIR